MKSRTILEVAAIAATIVIVTTSCSDSAKPGSSGQVNSNTPITIEPGVGVGKVRAGMSMDEVIAQLGKPDGKSGSRHLEYRRLGFAVGFGTDRAVKVVMCGNSSGVNDSLAKAFTGRTKDGLGLGSSRADVVKAYGEPSGVEKGPAGRESLKYSPLGLTFSLLDGKVYHLVVDFRAPKL
jgi:hypothetical protein